MDLSKLSEPLPIDSIDFRIQSINKGGYATILAYKDARVDMQRLDDVCGVLNWKREHTRDNQNCIVSIWCDEKKQWISKEDTGTESFAEKEKGLASDSFKRACFNFGIGRELYDYPIIQIKLNQNEFEIKTVKVNGKDVEKAFATFNLKIKEWTWYSKFDGHKIIELNAIDNNNNIRFTWSIKKKLEVKIPTIKDATADMKASKTIEEVKTKWGLYKQFQNVKAFIDVKEEMKTKLLNTDGSK